MKSVGFPKMINNKTSTNIIEDREATRNNIKNLLGSEKGSLFGDPYFGIRLKYYLFEQNSRVLKDILIDEIYSQIKVFIPQVFINRRDIDIIQTKRGVLEVKIKVTYRSDFTQENFSLVLFKEGER